MRNGSSVVMGLVVAVALALAPAPGRPGPGAEPSRTAAPAVARPPCQIQLATRLAQKRGRYEIEAVAANRTGARLRLRLTDRCPAGPVEFTGLTPGYDFHRTCAKGACAQRKPFIEIDLPPRETVVLDWVEVDPDHANCNRPLRPAHYALGFRAPSSAATVCGPEPVWIHHRVPPPAAPPPNPTKPAAPPARLEARRCPPMPACGLACPGGGFAHDERGCPRCACEKDPLSL